MGAESGFHISGKTLALSFIIGALAVAIILLIYVQVNKETFKIYDCGCGCGGLNSVKKICKENFCCGTANNTQSNRTAPI